MRLLDCNPSFHHASLLLTSYRNIPTHQKSKLEILRFELPCIESIPKTDFGKNLWFGQKRLEGLTEAELEALLEQVEEEKRRLASGEQLN